MSSSDDIPVREDNGIAILIFVTNFISLIATAIVEWAYSKYDQLRVTEFKYVLYICIADQAWAVIMLVDVFFYIAKYNISEIYPHSVYCQVQGFLKVYFGLVEFYWTAIICFSLQQSLFYQIKPTQFYKFWVIMVFIIPAYFATIPILNQTYFFIQPLNQVNCFINVEKPGHSNLVNDYTLLGCFYLQLWLIFAFNSYCVITVVINVKNQGEYPMRLREQINGLFCYPGILFICWSWVSANRILNMLGHPNNIFLDYCDYTFVGLSGLLNSIFYAYNSIRMRTPLIKNLQRLIGCQPSNDYTQSIMIESDIMYD